MGWDDGMTKICWAAFQDMGWAYESQVDVARLGPLMVAHGLKYELCEYHTTLISFFYLLNHVVILDIYPVIDACLDPGCSRFKCMLTDPSRHKAVLVTKDNGLFPIYTTSLYCRGEFQSLLKWHH